MSAAQQIAETERPCVKCPKCHKIIFDGDVIKSRIVKVLPTGAEAKCSCKSWVSVPLVYHPD